MTKIYKSHSFVLLFVYKMLILVLFLGKFYPSFNLLFHLGPFESLYSMCNAVNEKLREVKERARVLTLSLF